MAEVATRVAKDSVQSDEEVGDYLMAESTTDVMGRRSRDIPGQHGRRRRRYQGDVPRKRGRRR